MDSLVWLGVFDGAESNGDKIFSKFTTYFFGGLGGGSFGLTRGVRGGRGGTWAWALALALAQAEADISAT